MNIVDALDTWLKAHSEIELAILFGSYAKGNATQLSDVDVAIQLASGRCLDADDKVSYLDDLSCLLRKNIDLVDLRVVGQPLLSQIMKYGQCLVGKQQAFGLLAVRNVNSAQDFMPNIEQMLMDRRQRWLADG
jgi:predicted nucleotidyltransferase